MKPQALLLPAPSQLRPRWLPWKGWEPGDPRWPCHGRFLATWPQMVRLERGCCLQAESFLCLCHPG